MPCGESSLIKGIANQEGLYTSFKSFYVDTYHFFLLYPGLVSKQASSRSASLPVQPADPFRATASPDLGSSGRPRDWGWAAEARKQCAQCPRFVPKDSFRAKHPGDASAGPVAAMGESALAMVLSPSLPTLLCPLTSHQQALWKNPGFQRGRTI